MMDRERMSGGGIGSAGGEAGPWARRVAPVVVLMTATTLGCSGGGGSEHPTDPGPTGDATIEATVTAVGGQTSEVRFALTVLGSPEFGEVLDIDGNAYRTVIIDGRTWMAEDLRVGTYRNGEPIPEARSDTEWATAGAEGRGAWSYSYYDNDPANGAVYGEDVELRGHLLVP